MPDVPCASVESLSEKKQFVDALNEMPNTAKRTLQMTDVQFFEMHYVPDSTSQKHPQVTAHLIVVRIAALGS